MDMANRGPGGNGLLRDAISLLGKHCIFRQRDPGEPHCARVVLETLPTSMTFPSARTSAPTPLRFPRFAARAAHGLNLDNLQPAFCALPAAAPDAVRWVCQTVGAGAQPLPAGGGCWRGHHGGTLCTGSGAGHAVRAIYGQMEAWRTSLGLACRLDSESCAIHYIDIFWKYTCKKLAGGAQSLTSVPTYRLKCSRPCQARQSWATTKSGAGFTDTQHGGICVWETAPVPGTRKCMASHGTACRRLLDSIAGRHQCLCCYKPAPSSAPFQIQQRFHAPRLSALYSRLTWLADEDYRVCKLEHCIVTQLSGPSGAPASASGVPRAALLHPPGTGQSARWRWSQASPFPSREHTRPCGQPARGRWTSASCPFDRSILQTDWPWSV